MLISAIMRKHSQIKLIYANCLSAAGREAKQIAALNLGQKSFK